MPSITTSSNIAPLAISGNGRYFLDKKGKPFFWLGDTLWHLHRSFSPVDARAIMQNRKDKGFSVALVMLFGYEPDPMPNLNGESPWLDSDPSKPNEKYFEHVDATLRIACELDLIQVLGVYHKTQDRFYTPERAREQARWIANRYKDVPQIIWSMYPEARKQYVSIVKALAEGLKEGDGGAHWITVHPDPSPQSSSFMHDQPWLSFNMLQTCIDIEQIHAMTSADYAYTPIKPAVMAEGGYEGVEFNRPITPLDIRRQAYWTYLAGGHHIYGHNDNWTAPGKWRDWIDASRFVPSRRLSQGHHLAQELVGHHPEPVDRHEGRRLGGRAERRRAFRRCRLGTGLPQWPPYRIHPHGPDQGLGDRGRLLDRPQDRRSAAHRHVSVRRCS